MEDLEELHEIVDGPAYCAVTPHAPEWYLNPVFKTILGAEDGVFESLWDDHPLFFADHFLRVLKDDEPPALDFFRLLSSPARGDKPIWGVYSLLLEKMDVLWEDLLPWRREQATWESLCTHTAFLEKPPGDVEMSSEQLEAYNAARIVRAKQNMAKNSKAAEDREKAEMLSEETILAVAKNVSDDVEVEVAGSSEAKKRVLERNAINATVSADSPSESTTSTSPEEDEVDEFYDHETMREVGTLDRDPDAIRKELACGEDFEVEEVDDEEETVVSGLEPMIEEAGEGLMKDTDVRCSQKR
ncbi:hypothetical protein K4K55_007570 [Colletotrichum sp. SAR 10_96]|nr:hypothetical protein K4K55_007570 [Colletotrichum sp. SAR 10_96]